MKQEQQNQDVLYEFPYHYIPKFKGGFSQMVMWGWAKSYTSAIEYVIEEIKKDSNKIKTIFDIGCGDGRITNDLFAEFTDKKVIGIDYSQRAISLARALNPNIEFLDKDITSDEFKLKSDAITLVEVFEHIPLDLCDDFVKALHDALNDGGAIYLTVPHSNTKVSKKHYQHFSYGSLTKYFEKYFHVEDSKFIQKRSKMLKLYTKLMVNKLYIVRNAKLNNMYYNYYKKNNFNATEKNCTRIYLKLVKK